MTSLKGGRQAGQGGEVTHHTEPVPTSCPGGRKEGPRSGPHGYRVKPTPLLEPMSVAKPVSNPGSQALEGDHPSAPPDRPPGPDRDVTCSHSLHLIFAFGKQICF